MDESKLTELLESLEAALQVFKGSTSNGTTAAALPPSAAAQPSKEQLHALLERARTDISKGKCCFNSQGKQPPPSPLRIALVRRPLQLASCLATAWHPLDQSPSAWLRQWFRAAWAWLCFCMP